MFFTLPKKRKGNKEKIFYINFDFPPIGGPGIWRALGFVKYLDQRGYDISFFCSDKSSWCDRIDETNLDKIPSSVKVFRVKGLLLKDVRSFFSRKSQNASHWISKKIWEGLRWRVGRIFPTQAFLWTIKVAGRACIHGISEKPDIIFTSGPPHDSHLVGLILSKLFNARWVMDYRDLWFDDAMEEVPPRGQGLERFFEKLCLKNANHVVTVSQFWCAHLKGKYGLGSPDDKFSVVYNGHDIDPCRLAFEDSSTQDKFHIHYNGTPQANANGFEILEALKVSNDRYGGNPPFCVTFTGWSPEFGSYVASENLGGFVKNVGAMSQLKSIEYSFSADALMVLVVNTFNSRKGCIPSKTFEAMALGKHIFAVVPFGSDLVNVLREYGNATICDYDCPNEIANRLCELPVIAKKRNFIPNEKIIEKYSRSFQTGELIKVFDQKMSPKNF